MQKPTDRQAADKSAIRAVCVSPTEMFDVSFRFILGHRGAVYLLFEALSVEVS